MRTEDGRYVLSCAGTINDLKAHGVELHVGMHVALYTEDSDDDDDPAWLPVDAVVENDGNGFLARVSERTWRHEKQ